jgi:hypothetical protein
VLGSAGARMEMLLAVHGQPGAGQEGATVNSTIDAQLPESAGKIPASTLAQQRRCNLLKIGPSYKADTWPIWVC